MKYYVFLDDKNQVQGQYNMDIGYHIFKYQNESISKTYLEEVEFPGGKGLSLVIPDEQTFYSVELNPNDSKYIVFR